MLFSLVSVLSCLSVNAGWVHPTDIYNRPRLESGVGQTYVSMTNPEALNLGRLWCFLFHGIYCVCQPFVV